MNTGITPLQRRIYAFLVKHEKQKGYSPSFREIGSRFSLPLGSVQWHLGQLSKFRFISLPPKKTARGVRTNGEKNQA